jgi:hypothetical protein
VITLLNASISIHSLITPLVCLTVIFDKQSITDAEFGPHVIVSNISDQLSHLLKVFISKYCFTIFLALEDDVNVIVWITNFSELPVDITSFDAELFHVFVSDFFSILDFLLERFQHSS